MSSDNDFFLPTEEQWTQNHEQLLADLGKLLMSHPVARTSSYHAFAAMAQGAIKALVQSDAGLADAENVWRTAFTTLYPIEHKLYSDYIRKNGRGSFG